MCANDERAAAQNGWSLGASKEVRLCVVGRCEHTRVFARLPCTNQWPSVRLRGASHAHTEPCVCMYLPLPTTFAASSTTAAAAATVAGQSPPRRVHRACAAAAAPHWGHQRLLCVETRKARRIRLSAQRHAAVQAPATSLCAAQCTACRAAHAFAECAQHVHLVLTQSAPPPPTCVEKGQPVSPAREKRRAEEEPSRPGHERVGVPVHGRNQSPTLAITLSRSHTKDWTKH